MPTLSTSRHTRALSPPLSTSSQAFTIGTQPKLNIVTRLAIEGRAKHGQDGAAIKMYLKVCNLHLPQVLCFIIPFPDLLALGERQSRNDASIIPR